jgi:N-acetylneuraminate synthase
MIGTIAVNNRVVGINFPVYIIAELSANHNQDFNQALKLIHAAKAAGVDAVKVQTYTPDTLTIESDKKFFCIDSGSLWDGRTLYDLYKEANMPWDWQPKLKLIANQLGLDFFSTAFDASSVEFLEKMDVPIHKVASFEIVDIPLIQEIAKTGKPLIISTGMASKAEIKEAIVAAQNAGSKQIALLKCTSSYPAPLEDMNLRAIPYLIKTFKLPVGLSDHSLGTDVSIAAVALGACIIEKHLTLSRSVPGPDSAFSLEPQELKSMVDSIRIVEKTLGKAQYKISKSEMGSRVFRRSLFVVKDVVAGEVFTKENVRSIRPAYGLPPKYINNLLCRRAAKNIERGTPLTWDLVS